MDPRRIALCAFLAACDTDDPERERVPLDSTISVDIDASDAAERPGADATCATSVGTQDFDGDGFSRAAGDCDDCDPMRGPGALDFPNNAIDEDCDGADAIDYASCDANLEPNESEAPKALRAIGICNAPVGVFSRRWGLIDTSFSRLDGKGSIDVMQVGTPERFGVITPHEGARMLVLSTGVARDKKDRAFTDGCDVFDSVKDGDTGAWSKGVPPPKGFPRDAKACGRTPISKNMPAFNEVVLDVQLRAPTNATAISFDSLFLTYEYPDFVCSPFNDFFVVLMDPAPSEADKQDNILFDAQGDAVGVNSALLSVCRDAGRRVGRDVSCSRGAELLKDTGYDRYESSCAPLKQGDTSIGGASTGWLHTEMPVRAGKTFKLRFVLWDSGDPLLDSTVLLDNFRFMNVAPLVGTKPVTSD